MFIHVHSVVLQRGLSSLDGKLECFDTKKSVRQTNNCHKCRFAVQAMNDIADGLTST